MKFTVVTSFAILVGLSAAAADQPAMAFMEKAIGRQTFAKQSRSIPDVQHELVFAVKQNNLDMLHDILMDRSSHTSPRYQQWLSFEEVGSLTSNPAATTEIEAWLESNGVEVAWKSQRGEYIRARSSIAHWEELLSTEFYQWKDATQPAGAELVNRAVEYSLPASLDEHVHAVFKTVQTPPAFKPKYYKKKEVKQDGAPSKSFRSNLKVTAEQGTVNVAFLNEFYDIGSNSGSSSISQSVFETSSEYFSPDDLATFQSTYDLPSQDCVVQDGYSTENCISNDCYEGNLDVQYIMGVAQNVVSIYWYVPGNDPFVDYLTDISNESDPPLVNSISWGSIEQENSASEMNSFNTEALKLSSMGVTVTVSSGDDGAPNEGFRCQCTENSGSSQSSWTGSNSWSGEGYFPSFPASSPYVTAVGATQGPESGDPEIACQSQLGGIITSGGGFSTFYAAQDWQTSAVSTYFAGLSIHDTPTPGYNVMGRGYPDISFIGVWYDVIVQGQVINLFGTSASSPVFAAMLSLVNSARIDAGQSSVGFINPTLYQLGSNATFAAQVGASFNDVTSGDNKCCASSSGDPTCCDSGFTATSGWDPVTGWGSMDYTQLLKLFPVATSDDFYSDDFNGGDDDTAATPTKQPSKAPTREPTRLEGTPTNAPVILPSRQPTREPTPAEGEPTRMPTFAPTRAPTSEPIAPTVSPTVPAPTAVPTFMPTMVPTAPTAVPSAMPSYRPSAVPSFEPSASLSFRPSAVPSFEPTALPSAVPSFEPTAVPSFEPSVLPSFEPTDVPTAVPSFEPTAMPSFEPTAVPSLDPTAVPTVAPSAVPSAAPSFEPSAMPSFRPSAVPSFEPSASPSFRPSAGPSFAPSALPSAVPSFEPTAVPSFEPSVLPSFEPTDVPTAVPSFEPSVLPSLEPTAVPSLDPTASPSVAPSDVPSAVPSFEPSAMPSYRPSTVPTFEPSASPSFRPSAVPSFEPTEEGAPTLTPTNAPAGTNSGGSNGGSNNGNSAATTAIIIVAVAVVVGGSIALLFFKPWAKKPETAAGSTTMPIGSNKPATANPMATNAMDSAVNDL